MTLAVLGSAAIALPFCAVGDAIAGAVLLLSLTTTPSLRGVPSQPAMDTGDGTFTVAGDGTAAVGLAFGENLDLPACGDLSPLTSGCVFVVFTTGSADGVTTATG